MTGHFGKPPTAEEEKALFAAMHDPEGTAESRAAAREELIIRNLPLVSRTLEGLELACCPKADLLAYGRVALIETVDRFDPSRGNKLSTLAYHWIKRRVITMAVGAEFRIHVPAYVYHRLAGTDKRRFGDATIRRDAEAAYRTGSYGSSWGHTAASTAARPSGDDEPADAAPKAAAAVAAILDGLDPADADMLRRHYGIGRPAESFEEIGEARGIKPSAVVSRHYRVLAAIRKRKGVAA